MKGWKLAWIPLWADLPLYPVWIRPWGCAHLWGLGYLQGILLGKLMTGKPSRPGHWISPTRCLSAHLPVQPYLLPYFPQVHFNC